MGPTPGTSISRRPHSVDRASALIRRSVSNACVLTTWNCATSIRRHIRATCGTRSSVSSAINSISFWKPFRPFGAMTPYSAKCPRIAFDKRRRWRISSTRVRCSTHGALLLHCLYWNKTHARPTYRLADRFRIRRIVLLTLDVGFYIARRYQSHVVPDRTELPRPVVSSRARFNSDATRFQLLEETEYLRTPQAPPNNNFALNANAVDLKHRLGDIQPNHLDPLHRSPPSFVAALRCIHDGEPSTASNKDVPKIIQASYRIRQEYKLGGIPSCWPGYKGVPESQAAMASGIHCSIPPLTLIAGLRPPMAMYAGQYARQ